MSLVGLMLDFASDCTMQVRTTEPDGEGGNVSTWADGSEFVAAITHDQTIQARKAESEGMHSTYTVTTDRSVHLDFHDVFRRESDGKIFRVTSDATDKMTPSRASFAVAQVTAEEWRLT